MAVSTKANWNWQANAQTVYARDEGDRAKPHYVHHPIELSEAVSQKGRVTGKDEGDRAKPHYVYRTLKNLDKLSRHRAIIWQVSTQD